MSDPFSTDNAEQEKAFENKMRNIGFKISEGYDDIYTTTNKTTVKVRLSDRIGFIASEMSDKESMPSTTAIKMAMARRSKNLAKSYFDGVYWPSQRVFDRIYMLIEEDSEVESEIEMIESNYRGGLSFSTEKYGKSWLSMLREGSNKVDKWTGFNPLNKEEFMTMGFAIMVKKNSVYFPNKIVRRAESFTSSVSVMIELEESRAKDTCRMLGRKLGKAYNNGNVDPYEVNKILGKLKKKDIQTHTVIRKAYSDKKED